MSKYGVIYPRLYIKVDRVLVMSIGCWLLAFSLGFPAKYLNHAVQKPIANNQ